MFRSREGIKYKIMEEKKTRYFFVTCSVQCSDGSTNNFGSTICCENEFKLSYANIMKFIVQEGLKEKLKATKIIGQLFFPSFPQEITKEQFEEWNSDEQ